MRFPRSVAMCGQVIRLFGGGLLSGDVRIEGTNSRTTAVVSSELNPNTAVVIGAHSLLDFIPDIYIYICMCNIYI